MPRSTDGFPVEGGCACGSIRFRVVTAPMIVHCCHCSWCQRESGSAFALNALVESDRVEMLQGEVDVVDTPSNSGRGQRIARCPRCRVAVWSHYAGAGDAVRFVRVGALDRPDTCPPDIHIFTSTKQGWLELPEGVPQVAEYYRRSEIWPTASIARYQRATGQSGSR